jgi:hypothetical protein
MNLIKDFFVFWGPISYARLKTLNPDYLAPTPYRMLGHLNNILGTPDTVKVRLVETHLQTLDLSFKHKFMIHL